VKCAKHFKAIANQQTSMWGGAIENIQIHPRRPALTPLLQSPEWTNGARHF
jgi:hypothetical protein